MPNYVDTLKEIRRVSERALAERSKYGSHAAMCGHLEANMIHLRILASSTLKVCGELYWSKVTKPEDIARSIADDIADELKCHVKVERTGDNGDEDIGFELVTGEHGNFCFAVRLEGLMWRVYKLPIDKCSQPLKNVGELIKEACAEGVATNGRNRTATDNDQD